MAYRLEEIVYPVDARRPCTRPVCPGYSLLVPRFSPTTMSDLFVHAVQTLLLATHLVCVNVSMCGPLVCLWLDRRQRRRGDPAAAVAARLLADWSLWLLIVGTLLGLALGMLHWWSGNELFFAALTRLSGKVTFGVWEILFSLVCLGLYAWGWRAPRQRLAWRVVHQSLAVLGTTNLLYHFPLLFGVITQLQVNGQTRGDEIDASEFRHLMMDGEVLATTLHVWIAALATAGVALMVIGVRRPDAGDAGEFRPVIAWGARIALAATLLQIPSGVWLMTHLTQGRLDQLLGGDALGTLMFLGALVATFGLLHLLSAIAMRNDDRSSARNTIGLFLAIVLLMSGTRTSATSAQQQTLPPGEGSSVSIGVDQ